MVLLSRCAIAHLYWSTRTHMRISVAKVNKRDGICIFYYYDTTIPDVTNQRHCLYRMRLTSSVNKSNSKGSQLTPTTTKFSYGFYLLVLCPDEVVHAAVCMCLSRNFIFEFYCVVSPCHLKYIYSEFFSISLFCNAFFTCVSIIILYTQVYDISIYKSTTDRNVKYIYIRV